MTRLRAFVGRHHAALLWCVIGGGVVLFIISVPTPTYFGWFHPFGALSGMLIGNSAVKLWILRRNRRRAARGYRTE